MSETFYIKQNDTSPALRYALIPTVNLTGASVVFNMRPRGSTTVKVSRQTATVVAPATSGIVEYSWAAADTDTMGDYEAEFEITYSDATVETFPNASYIAVKVTDDIA